ncbi:MAG: alpha-hydroxy-acid oxidizing protein [Rhodospirillaceae bacterium]|nr:MAG: alpha-hydroxy-acid oxidizing protein [Rhodospirillaceae bacterium]
MPLAKCLNFSDFRHLAKRRLPAPLFHYIDGGADDEVALRRNTAAFDDYELMPRQLTDVSTIDTRTQIFGKTIAWPVLLSPTAMSRLFHHQKELAVARAAANMGTLYSLSTLATTSLEEVAAASAGPKMFQIYVLKDRGFVNALVARCKAAKYDALCVTVDTPLAGNRERDHIHGMTLPPKFGLADLASFALHPAWSLNFIRDPDFRVANVAEMGDAKSMGGMGLIQYVNAQIDRTATWDDIARLIELWKGPFAIKGLQSAADARMAQQVGATAIMISNHGGRQLDGAPAPVDCIAPMRDAIGNTLEIICDGGIRRGTHVLKALALGANACSIGRPYLFGLAGGGQAGVEHVLSRLRGEIELDMTLMGCRRIADLDNTFLAKRREP